MPVSSSSCKSSTPLLIVLSGPSGVGKDAVLSRMRGLGKSYHFTVTATTRPQRPTERDGLDYIFVSIDTFQLMIQREEVLEWAMVYGHLYGVPKTQVLEALNKGQNVLIKTDVQGAATIKKLAPEALFIFLSPPSVEALHERLNRRMTESSETLHLRLKAAESEMSEMSKFDFVVVNRDGFLDEAAEEIDRIVEQEIRRLPNRKISL